MTIHERSNKKSQNLTAASHSSQMYLLNVVTDCLDVNRVLKTM